MTKPIKRCTVHAINLDLLRTTYKHVTRDDVQWYFVWSWVKCHPHFVSSNRGLPEWIWWDQVAFCLGTLRGTRVGEDRTLKNFVNQFKEVTVKLLVTRKINLLQNGTKCLWNSFEPWMESTSDKLDEAECMLLVFYRLTTQWKVWWRVIRSRWVFCQSDPKRWRWDLGNWKNGWKIQLSSIQGKKRAFIQTHISLMMLHAWRWSFYSLV